MKHSTWLSGLLLAVIVPTVRADEKPAGEQPKSANWLVDAMAEKPAVSRGELRLGATRPVGRVFGTASSPYVLPKGQEANPLSSYLATWMTPRDIEILKINEGAARASGVAVSPEQRRLAASAAAAGPRENPYLVDLSPPSAPTSKVAATTPAQPPPSLALPAPKNDAAPAKTPGPPPDLIKAKDEQKYFPQLKRF